MEHLNHIMKDTVSHTGANKTLKAIMRASKALGPLKDILKNFDKTNGVWSSGKHTQRSESEDLDKMVIELATNKVFHSKPGRKHNTFSSIKCNQLFTTVKRFKKH